jgi:YesN/AraC family two-component response regulator
MASHDKPDIVLLDLKMPGLSGIETLQRLMAIDPDLVVIVLTGHGSMETVKEAMRLGAYDYLTKPVTPEFLEEIMADNLSLKKRDQSRHGTMRGLIYVPIVHTAADMGSLLPGVRDEYVERHGRGKWERHNTAIQRFWLGLRRRIVSLDLDCERTYLYQDGLPDCDRALDIVKDLARQGVPNHRLLLWLIERGATLIGTEETQLLTEEYELMRGIYKASSPEQQQNAREKYRSRAPELLARRDEYIRRKIDNSLPPGATGLLFIGLQHHVDVGLAKDISVSYLIHRLP